VTQLPARLGVESEGIWGFIAELNGAVIACARELGMASSEVNGAADESAVDVVLTVGSVNLYPDLLARPKTARRVLWHVEPLPLSTGERGERVHRALPTGKLLDLGRAALPPVARTGTWRRWREQAANVREPVTNLAWLRRHAGALDRIVVDTAARAEGAVAAGLAVDVVPFGYHPGYAGPLADPSSGREVDVLTMANISPLARRHRLIAAIGADLRTAGIELFRMPDHTYGAQRRQLLDRARVVIDVHRLPGSHPLFRFILSAAAGAAMISEPLARPEPLVPGVHYVEAAVADMAQATRDLLADEPRRRRIVAAAQALLTSDLDLHRTLPLALG
jgi:glycosyl transferase family 1